MTTTLSPFQTLPMLIVEKVIEYMEERARYAFDTDYDVDIDEYNKEKAVSQLLLVSERWRVAALSLICDNCEIKFNSSDKGYHVTYPALPVSFSFPQYRLEKLVKRVVVKAPSWNDLGSKKFNITPSQPEFPIFPSAATLMVCLDEDDVAPAKARRDKLTADNAAPPNRNQETINFVRSIRRLTPAATGVVVLFRSPSSTNKKNRGQCNTLLLQLGRGKITRLQVESWTECPLSTLKLRSMSGLTSIRLGHTTACAPFAQVAYLNASTLMELDIKSVEQEDWRAVIYGDTKTPAVYGSLTKLVLEPVRVAYETHWAAIDHAIPFPALLELNVTIEYPFNDDLLFRGNGRTLQKMTLPYRALTKNILGRFNVFNRSGAKRMNVINIDAADPTDSAELTRLGSTYVTQQIYSILEVTTMLRLQGDTDGKHALNAIRTAPSTAVIQGLEIFDLPLDASNILSIVSAVPTLTTLACQVDVSVPTIEELLASDHPNALREEYSLNSNFRHLYFLEDETDDENWGDVQSDSDDDDDGFGGYNCPCCGGFHYGRNDDLYDDMFEDHYRYGGHSDFDNSEDEYEDVDEDEDVSEDEGEGEVEVEGVDEDEVSNDHLARGIAVVAVQIAIVCPKFRHVDLPEYMRDVFSREVALAMANGPFLPYADSLSRLIFPE